MRIDKFLKNSRIIKRRTVAKEACEQGRVKINDSIVKAGDNVSIGDIIEISFGTGTMKIEALELIEGSKKQDAEKMYKLLS